MPDRRVEEELDRWPPAAGSDQGWQRSRRLRDRRSYQRVQRGGRRWRGQHVIVCWAAPTTPQARFGLTVSRKVGNSVVRNRVKRWLREALRRRAAAVAPVDVVVIALPSAAEAGLSALSSDLDRGLKRLASSR